MDGKQTRAASGSPVSVVIPLLNELPTIEELYARLTATLRPLERDYEILFVDDGGTDGSIEVLRRLASLDPRVRYLRFRRNFGKSAALAAGFRSSRFDVVVTIDGDLQEAPEALPRMLEKLEAGYDLVSGWRRSRRDRWSRRLASRLYNWVTRRLTGVRLRDINCGFKCYNREVLDEVMVYGERHRYVPVLASYRGFRLADVEVEHAPRRHGASRYGLERIAGGFFGLLTVILMTRYTNKPLHFFGVLGALLFVAGSLLVVADLGVSFLGAPSASGQLLILLGALLVVMGLQLTLFGLLAEMIVFSYRRDGDYSIVETSETRGDLPRVVQPPVEIARRPLVV